MEQDSPPTGPINPLYRPIEAELEPLPEGVSRKKYMFEDASGFFYVLSIADLRLCEKYLETFDLKECQAEWLKQTKQEVRLDHLKEKLKGPKLMAYIEKRGRELKIFNAWSKEKFIQDLTLMVEGKKSVNKVTTPLMRMIGDAMGYFEKSKPQSMTNVQINIQQADGSL